MFGGGGMQESEGMTPRQMTRPTRPASPLHSLPLPPPPCPGDLGWRVPQGVPGSVMGGNLVLTGRAKDTIVLSCGKNVRLDRPGELCPL